MEWLVFPSPNEMFLLEHSSKLYQQGRGRYRCVIWANSIGMLNTESRRLSSALCLAVAVSVSWPCYHEPSSNYVRNRLQRHSSVRQSCEHERFQNTTTSMQKGN
jgi:hypothetical protein